MQSFLRRFVDCADCASPHKQLLLPQERAARLKEIHARHYREMAEKSGIPHVWNKMIDLMEKVPKSLEAVEKRLPPKFPASLWERVSKGMLSQTPAFKNQALNSKP